MKLTDEENVEEAKAKEQLKENTEETGTELTDEAMENVSGGILINSKLNSLDL